MRVIKPTEISVQLRPFQFEGQHQLAIGILMAHPFDSTEPPFSEQDLWTLASEHLSQWDAFDEGMPKAFAEYLVYGNYYAKEPVSADEVQVQVGPLSKTLIVTGQREWRKITGSSEPQALTELPISYEFAYGGEGFEQNPVGMGRDGVLMPQLEHPDSRFSHPKTDIIPVGFTARNIEWLPRKTLWGTYNERWQQQDAPGFARDIQWQIFQLAPEDQWLKTPHWSGGESFRVRNMHPEQSVQDGKLPQIRVRCFALKNDELFEISAKYETVWLYPNASAQIAGYRAQISLETFDGQEISALMVAYESAGSAKKSHEHYATALEKRLLPEGDEEDLLDSALRADDRELSVLNPEPVSEKVEAELPGSEAALGLGALAVLAKLKGGKGGGAETASSSSAEAKSDEASAVELASAAPEEQSTATESADAEAVAESEGEAAPSAADDAASAEPEAPAEELLALMESDIQKVSELTQQALSELGVDQSMLTAINEEGGVDSLLSAALPDGAPKIEPVNNLDALAEQLSELQKLADEAGLDQLVDVNDPIDEAALKHATELAAKVDLESAIDPKIMDALRKGRDKT